MSTPTYAPPPWAHAVQPPCMPGCEVDHFTTGKCIADGEDEWTHDGNITCRKFVLRDHDMVVQVSRSAYPDHANDWAVVVDPVRVYFHLRVCDDSEDVEADEARRLAGKLAVAIESAASLADELNRSSS